MIKKGRKKRKLGQTKQIAGWWFKPKFITNSVKCKQSKYFKARLSDWIKNSLPSHLFSPACPFLPLSPLHLCMSPSVCFTKILSLSLSLGPTEKTPSSSHLLKPNNLIPLSKRPLLSRLGSWGLVFMTQCDLPLTRIPFYSLANQSKLPLVFLPMMSIPLSSSKCRKKNYAKDEKSSSK